MVGWRRDFRRVDLLVEGTPRQVVGGRTLYTEQVLRLQQKEFDVEYRTNSWGYFDREWDQTRGGESLRLAFLGDSFTMGHGVEQGQSFPFLMGESLESVLDRRVEVMNFGMWGTGTLEHEKFLPDVLANSPDEVILIFFVNDVIDNIRFARKASSETNQLQVAPALEVAGSSWLAWLRLTLNRQSRAFAFVFERTERLRNRLGLITYPLEGVFTGRSSHLFQEAGEIIRSMDSRLEAESIPLTVVYLPHRMQVTGQRVPSDFDLRLPNTLLAQNLAGIRWIDLTDSFLTQPDPDLWFDEGHLNGPGHRRVAEWLTAEFLRVNPQMQSKPRADLH